MKTYEVRENNGTQVWQMNDKLHREDGPAIECADGYKAWYLNGKLHREDGPAVVWADGNKAWYLYGVMIDEEVFLKRSKKHSLIKTLIQCQINEDTENAHSVADQALLDYINDDQITELYDSIDKWYA
jgi:hypothetical protein